MRISEKIEYRNVHDLAPHPQNWEYNSYPTDSERTLLKESIQKEGILEPLWISEDDTIISGHCRLEIALELSMSEVPVRLILDATAEDLLYLLITSQETRRGDEKDIMKRARKLRILHERWNKERAQSQTGTITENKEIMALAGSKSGAYRLLRLNDLIPELQGLVSDGKIGQQAGYELAGMPVEEQKNMYKAIVKSGVGKVRFDEAKAIREEWEESGEILPPVTEESLVANEVENQIEDELETDNARNNDEKETAAETIRSVLPKDEADQVKIRVFIRRANNFQRRFKAFQDDLKHLLQQQNPTDEVKQILLQLAAEARALANSLEQSGK